MAIPPYTITRVTDSQEENPATENIVNTFEVSFTATFPPAPDGTERVYTSVITVPKVSDNTVAAVKTAVENALAEVAAVYALGTPPPPAP